MILPADHLACLPARIRQGLVALETAFADANRSALAVAARLAETERGRWAEAMGFDDVAALAAVLFGCPRRKTYLLIAIHRMFVERLACPPEILAAIPWSKLAALLPVVSGENIESWLARARAVPLRALLAEIRYLRRGEPLIPRVTKTFAIPTEAEAVLELALDRIGREAGTDDRGRQLELLAADALAGPAVSPPGPGRRPWVVLLAPAERRRLTTALSQTGQGTPAEALMALVDHALCCSDRPSPWTPRTAISLQEKECRNDV
jgi:hypothetical protein